MRRISTATRVIDKFGAGKDGFTNGDAVSGLPATDMEDVWFDHVQEEIANVIEAAGATLSAANRAQLLAAINTLVGTGRFLGVKIYTASGTHTPDPRMTKSIVKVQGGGGGSGGAPATAAGAYSGSPGGSSGSYAECLLTAAQIGASQPVTIGAAGAAGAAGTSTGGNGGTTSFGSLILCPGGLGSSSYGPTSNTVTLINAAGGASAPTTSGTVISSTSGNTGGAAIGSNAGGVVNSAGAISPMDSTTVGPGRGAPGAALSASSGAVAGSAGGAGKIIVLEFS